MAVDREALRSGLARLAKTLPAEVAIDVVLEEVVEAVGVLFGLAGAGVLAIDEQQALRSMISSDPRGGALERGQLEFGHGPCVDAFVLDTTVACSDITGDPRYPLLGQFMVEHGVRAVLGVPIRLGGGPVGALNVYAERPHQWTDHERGTLEAYTRMLAGLLQLAMAADQRGRVAEQLQYALQYRIPIERAVGFLMAGHDVDAVEAFNRLRRTSRDQQRRVAEVAAEILRHRQIPPDMPASRT